MIRKAVTAICLLLALATVGVGVSSWNREVVFWQEDSDKLEFVSGRGKLSRFDPKDYPTLLQVGAHPETNAHAETTLAVAGGYLIWDRRCWDIHRLCQPRHPRSQGIEARVPSGRAHRNWLICQWYTSAFRAWRRASQDDETVRFLFVTREANVRVSAWFLFVLFCTYPTIAFIRGPYRRYRRRKKGLCLKCGYNLTGNVSGVCPECGERI